MADFTSIKECIESAATLDAKIVAIDAIITALTLSALDAAGTGNFSEYYIDNGQTKVRTTYRSVTDVALGIKNLEAVKQIYINQKRGRVVRLMDSSNFLGRLR